MPLLDQLCSRGRAQPGYLFGETLKSLDNPGDYMVVSKWETVEDW
jgi:heme-degrading monooxygenase HmoA